MTVETKAEPAIRFKNHALVWQKVSALPIFSWTDEHHEESILEVTDDKLSGQDKQAVAMGLREKFINSLQFGDTVWMLMGGVGDEAAMMMHYRRATVKRVPPRYLAQARQALGSDEEIGDHQLISRLAQEKPELFYDMTSSDALRVELMTLVQKLYTFQRRIRIPLTLRLIAHAREELLLERVKAGLSIEDMPAMAIMEELVEEDVAESEQLPDEEQLTKGKPKKSKAKKIKEKKPKVDSRLTPDQAIIAAQLKDKIDDNPSLREAAKEEKRIERQIAKLLPRIDFWKEILELIPGIGPRIGGRMIGFWVTPVRFEGKTPYHSQGNFQAYTGWTVAPDGRAQRKRRDANMNYRPDLRQALFNWWSWTLKSTSVWRLWWDRIKVQVREGWTSAGERHPGYAEKRTRNMMADHSEIRRFLTEPNLRRRVNKALKEMVGEEELSRFKDNKANRRQFCQRLKADRELLFEYLPFGKTEEFMVSLGMKTGLISLEGLNEDEEKAEKRKAIRHYRVAENLRAAVTSLPEGEDHSELWASLYDGSVELMYFLCGARLIAEKIWMSVFDPDLWKSHVLKQSMRKLIKYLLMYIWHQWCKLEDLPYQQSVIDWVRYELSISEVEQVRRKGEAAEAGELSQALIRSRELLEVYLAKLGKAKANIDEKLTAVRKKLDDAMLLAVSGDVMARVRSFKSNIPGDWCHAKGVEEVDMAKLEKATVDRLTKRDERLANVEDEARRNQARIEEYRHELAALNELIG